MKRADAQKIVDDQNDEDIKSSLLGMMTELRDKPNDPAVIETYRRRIANFNASHAEATYFIAKNFGE